MRHITIYLIIALLGLVNISAQQIAPINPDFIKFQDKKTTIQTTTPAIPGLDLAAPKRALGYIPSPVDLSHLITPTIKKSVYIIDGAVYTDPYYDMRDDVPIRLSEVRDQGNCGACWAFAAYGAMESQLLPGEVWDFSENNMKNEHGFDINHCDGGNTTMSNAYLARWAGPKREADDPYTTVSPYNPTSPAADTYKHLQEALYIAPRANSTDNDGIKQAIITYGAVSSSMYWDDTDPDVFNSGTNAYYYKAGTSSNHAITIVGWDDNFAATNFTDVPAGGDGAFIVRNSWGSSWGDGGYFYISYYDTVLGTIKNLVYSNVEEASNYSKVYEYDPLGWTGGIGYDTEDSMANIFTATDSDVLSAVSFYTTDIGVAYVVDVYTGVTADNPISGTLETSTFGTFTNAGYHTVSISTVGVLNTQKFSIVVKLTNTSYAYPIAIEEPIADYSSEATASVGESFVSSDGATWEYLTDYVTNGNVCLKAFVTSQDTSDPSDVGSVNDGAGADIDFVGSSTTLSANWSEASDPESGIAKYWYSVGTNPEAADIVGWTDNGFDISVTTADLSLIAETTYYFSVKAENGVGLESSILSSNGQLVDITPPPDIPEVRDDTSSSSDADYTTVDTQLSANWTTVNDTESGIAKYWYAIGTSPGSTDTTVGWIDNGTSWAVTKGGLSLSNGTTYYFTVKAENGAGLQSVVTNSDGQTLDTTVPASVAVNDGTGTVNIEYVGSSTTISANWSESADAQSGILKYWYAIETSLGAADIIGWTDNSLSTEVTKTGLDLTDGVTYYFSVKAENGAGLKSVTGSSNGQIVDTLIPVITEVNDSLGADIAHVNSTTTLSANWAGTDANGEIVKYYFAIGSTPGATDIISWTDNNLSISTTVIGLSLNDDDIYYFSVKAVDNVGLESNVVSSNGQLTDMTAPDNITTVNDGVSSDITYINSVSQLSAYWSSANDNGSGIAKYWYAIGTTAGATDKVGWTTDNSTNTFVTKTGLTLAEGSTYYFTVKSENGVGLKSDITNSNGQMVDTTSPTAKIEISSPLPAKTGNLEFKLIINEANETQGNPSLIFVGSDGVQRDANLEQLNSSTWTGTAFIESYISTGSAAFAFSMQDAAGNTGSAITAGSSFNIDTSFDGTSTATITNSDGTGIIFPAGGYAGNIIINISTIASSSVSSAEANTHNSSALPSIDLNREFAARDMAYNSIINFSEWLTLKIAYPDADNNGRVDTDNIDETALGLYYLDDSLNKWLLVDGMVRNFSANYVQAEVSHFSIYSIRYVGTAQPAMSQIKVYPNPCKMKISGLTFENIPVQASNVKIDIYNVAGNLVRTLDRSDGINILNMASWDGKNESGRKVASGLYVYLIKTAAHGTISGKVVVLW